MGAPVKAMEPLLVDDEAKLWNQEAGEWSRLNREAWGNQDFTAITTKAMYVIGVIYTICRSVDVLLAAPDARQATYIPAYGVFASGIEILGRCVRGDANPRGTAGKNLKAGFKWLAPKDAVNVNDDYKLVKTSSGTYTVDMLANMRHFAAHGQTDTARKNEAPYTLGEFDFEILEKLLPKLICGLERYWHQVNEAWGANQDLCNNLAKAKVLAFRNWPVKQILRLFEWDPVAKKHHSLTKVFSRFGDWRI